jgi:dolichyl-phosphate beta-glucosyltransferase
LDSLSIVVPAYNEHARLPATLEKLLAAGPHLPLRLVEILVVDDGSTDGTVEAVQRIQSRTPLLRVLGNDGNRGKGYSVRNGMLEASGDWILFTDADLSTPIEELNKLYERTRSSGALAAIGSRALDRDLIEIRQSRLREYSGCVFNMFMRAVTGLPFADTQCGFKLYRADAARRIFSRQKLNGFSFDVEDLFIARQLDIPVIEVPVRWRNAEGSKVSLLRGLESFLDVTRIWSYEKLGFYRAVPAGETRP